MTRPPQGTHNVRSERQENAIKVEALAIAKAAQAAAEDPLIAALRDAKRGRDEAALARLLPSFRERCGSGPHALRLFRAL